MTINQRMFHGGIKSAALADQLAVRFTDRQRCTKIQISTDTAFVQIGSSHGTPITNHISDTSGGVLIKMGRDRDWLDRLADSTDILERAIANPLSFLACLPDIAGEFNKENLVPLIWNAINDICSLTRSLAVENNAPMNPIICEICRMINVPESFTCAACGGTLNVSLPRKCPRCELEYQSTALFCQACGPRLIEG
jgi:hypothetical protein